MEQSMEGKEPDTQQVDELPSWARATLADIEGANFDFEGCVRTSTAADCHELHSRFEAAAQSLDAQGADAPAAHVLHLLSAIMGMTFRPDNRLQPFGPMFEIAGRRTAIPSDLRNKVDLLAKMARRFDNPLVRSRLSDLAWLLDRRRGQCATDAVDGYCEVVRRVLSGRLRYRFERDGALHHEAQDYIRRALAISLATGFDKPTAVAAKELLILLANKAAEQPNLPALLWFSRLSLSFSIENAGDISNRIEAAIASVGSGQPTYVIVPLLLISADAYRRAKEPAAAYRCQIAAADCHVTEASKFIDERGSPMLAAQALSDAITLLHGVPDQNVRRTELRHRLVDVQARVPEELSTFSQEVDIREEVMSTAEAFSKLDLTEQLFGLALFERSPDPEKLRADAIAMTQEFPLMNMFGMAHLDKDGKVISRTSGGIAEGDNEASIERQIAQAESLRRNLVVSGGIEPARRTIAENVSLSADILETLLSHSPFVPNDQVKTFARGFELFFSGERVSALYVLIPLLESGLRQLLRAAGHDVTKFDDATQTQEDKTLSALLDQMRDNLTDILGAPLVIDIINVCTSKIGPNIRNRVAHGLLSDGDPYGQDAIYACWLIYRLCLIPLYSHRDHFVFRI